jgi:hypothetical protein
MGPLANEQQLQLLLRLVCESVNSQVTINPKLLRDILDVVEGLMRGSLNSKGKYDHASLKLNCMFESGGVQSLRSEMGRRELLSVTRREHAVPLKVLLKQLYQLQALSPVSLKDFLDQNLISVLITRDEQRFLDTSKFKLREKMPAEWDGVNVFARFEIVGIHIAKRQSSQATTQRVPQ